MARRRKEETKDKGNFDYSLLLIIFCVIGFGLLMIYSSSSYTAQISNDDSASFLKKQLMSVGVGLIPMFFGIATNYRLYLKKVPLLKIRMASLIYIVAVFLQTYVLLSGTNLNGSSRWINILGFSFQPSEFAKFAVIILTAYYINKHPNAINTVLGIILTALPMLVLIVLVAWENLSAGIIITAIVYCMLLIATKKKKTMILFGLGGGACILGLVLLMGGYRMERIEVFMNVFTHEKGFQIRQGLYAIASGGILGNGLGGSMQKLAIIPEPQNDMIFSIVCEELGIVGASIVILMFIFMCWRLLNGAMNAPNLFSSMICCGVLVQVAVQVILNIAVVLHVIPATGISLPFISYGGSSVLMLMFEMGIVLGITAISEPESEEMRGRVRSVGRI